MSPRHCKILAAILANHAAECPLRVADLAASLGVSGHHLYRVAATAGVPVAAPLLAGRRGLLAVNQTRRVPVVRLGPTLLRRARLDRATKLRYHAEPGRITITLV